MSAAQEPDKSRSQDQVTLLIFKDHHVARSFQFSLSWLSRLGLLAGSLVVTTLVTTLFAFKYYRLAKQADLSRVHALEQELADLKAAPLSTPSSTPSIPANVASVTPSPVPSPATTPSIGIPDFNLSSMLPAQSLPALEPKQVPITVESLRLSWHQKNLKVQFGLNYSWDDGGTQKGTIIVVAHGPKTLASYPARALETTQNQTTLTPRRGEYFAVSRFREVNAELGPFNTQSSLEQIEILIFNREGQVLIHKSVDAPQNTKSP